MQTIPMRGEEGYAEYLAKRYPAEPQQITREAYIDALECLPPNDWYRGATFDSFKLCELAYDNVTSIYVRRGNVYWRFYGAADMPRGDILKTIQEAEDKLP